MTNSNDRNVVPNPKGGWDVKAAGASRSSAHADTQAEAIDRGRQIIGNAGGGELNIHGRNGQIRAKDTIAPGNDPRNVRG
ncbi:DUF2188 domain-containing protein [Curtobacterium sp. RIT-PI-V]|uniref:DUF2188 domain-containing protein n=1 Tax=Curtobacterium sp. RIT-PI-V TaxID=3035296 RepID=UPI0021D7A23B|nr:DUF2188 domain-containing protein [Curtobacterium sp. RIT-PI-V]